MKSPIIIGGQKIGRLRASFLLLKESWRFLRADKELLLVPLITAFLSLVMIGVATLFFILISGDLNRLFAVSDGVDYLQYAYIFSFYFSGAFSLAISQAAIVHIVYVRAHGGNASLGQGLSKAFSRTAPLLLWSMISSTIGLILRAVTERSELLGRIVATILGTAWAVMTFFVVPVIILEAKNAKAATVQSAKLFKKTWGETLIANVGLGLAFFVLHILAILVLIGLFFFSLYTGSAVLYFLLLFGTLGWFMFVVVAQSALQGILKTLLYILAAENKVPENFNRELLESMLVRKVVSSEVTQPLSVNALG